MRCMVRNKQDFYYALYSGKTEIIDEYGNATGQYKIVYSDPVKTRGNVSAAQGEMQNRQFGDSETYDKVIVLGNKSVPIDEYTILWVDSSPSLNEDGSLATNEDGTYKSPHDYVVKKVARSLNNVSLAISKVMVR